MIKEIEQFGDNNATLYIEAVTKEEVKELNRMFKLDLDEIRRGVTIDLKRMLKKIDKL